MGTVYALPATYNAAQQRHCEGVVVSKFQACLKLRIISGKVASAACVNPNFEVLRFNCHAFHAKNRSRSSAGRLSKWQIVSCLGPRKPTCKTSELASAQKRRCTCSHSKAKPEEGGREGGRERERQGEKVREREGKGAKGIKGEKEGSRRGEKGEDTGSNWEKEEERRRKGEKGQRLRQRERETQRERERERGRERERDTDREGQSGREIEGERAKGKETSEALSNRHMLLRPRQTLLRLRQW